MNSEFRPDWTSAPGDTIADILRERSISEVEFANGIERTIEEAKSLIEGQSSITIATARLLEATLGSSVAFWMSRDFQYRQDMARLTDEWMNELPLADMVKFGWLPKPEPADEVSACFRFFDVPNITAWNAAYNELQRTVAFRTSAAFSSTLSAVAAWIRQGEIEAATIECKPWNPEAFQRSLSEIRRLTRAKNPERFLPELRSLCSESGVAVVSLRAPNGCRASGATRFLSAHKALLMLSFRHLSDDQFWFSFFHEAGHLLLHGQKGIFVEAGGMHSTTEEEEANTFAAHTLVPPEFHWDLLNLKTDSMTVIRFAMKVGISPGIIVGQLQHLGHLRRNQLNGLKRRYEWVK